MAKLAMFDLDHTLIGVDSDDEWPKFLADLGILGEDARIIGEKHMRDYEAGVLDLEAFLAFQLSPLKGHTEAELEALRSRYVQTVIRPAVLPKVMGCVEKHRAEGDETALVSATNEFLVEPIGNMLGFQNIIASRLERDGEGRFTGRTTGVRSYREGKVERVAGWLAQSGRALGDFEETHFYSDSFNDLPLLGAVTHPHAVNPDPKLRRIAQESGWDVIEA